MSAANSRTASKRAHRELSAVPEPYSFRLPKNSQTDPYFGATRTWWNEKILGDDPPVDSFLDKQPGTKRGIRFIVFASAKRYFDNLRKSQGKAA